MSNTENLLAELDIKPDTFSNSAGFINTVRSGLSGKVLKEAVRLLDNREIMIKVLGTSSGNLSRYYQRQLKTQEAEEVLDTIRIYHEAHRVFGDSEKAREWLKMPLPALAGEAPENLFDTFEGRHWIAQTLKNIEFGEFS